MIPIGLGKIRTPDETERLGNMAAYRISSIFALRDIISLSVNHREIEPAGGRLTVGVNAIMRRLSGPGLG